MQLTSTTKEILAQLSNLCNQLNSEDYARNLPLLMDNSIGKHIRHILEFYDRLMGGSGMGLVNYDHREHNQMLEGSVDLARKKLAELTEWVDELRDNCELKMRICYDNQTSQEMELETNLNRELVYNIEHAIHHMAIIRIALEQEFKEVKVDPNFGIAYSTIKFRDDQCAH